MIIVSDIKKRLVVLIIVDGMIILGDDYAVGKHLLVQERKGEKKKYLVITDSSKQVD